METTNLFDRQDKGEDHYSDMIRSPTRSVKTFNKLMWNERRQSINLNQIDRIHKRNLNETNKHEKFYIDKLEKLNQIKRLNKNDFQVTNSSIGNITIPNKTMLSIALRNKLNLSAKRSVNSTRSGAIDESNHSSVTATKPLTIYEMHLVDSKKLMQKAKVFLKQLNENNSRMNDNASYFDSVSMNNMNAANYDVVVNNYASKSIESFNGAKTSKSDAADNASKVTSTSTKITQNNSVVVREPVISTYKNGTNAPRTTPIFATELIDLKIKPILSTKTQLNKNNKVKSTTHVANKVQVKKQVSIVNTNNAKKPLTPFATATVNAVLAVANETAIKV